MTEKNNLLHTAFDEAYTYDALNRLTTSTDESFAMDALGNITTADGTSRTSNSQNQLTVVGSNNLAYDNNGNASTDDQGHTLAYDAWNRLISVKNGGTLLKSYTYDGMGRRVTEYDGTTTLDLYYSAQGQVLEEDKSGHAYVQNVWSPVYVNALVLRDRDANNSGDGVMEERIYMTQDANFNVTSMVAYVSSTWSVSVRVVYNAYGSATFYTSAWASGSNTYAMSTLFQGMRYDVATGLYHAGARDYSPTMMTWVQQDPMGYVDGANDRAFVGGNPVGAVDPMGSTKILVVFEGRMSFPGGHIEHALQEHGRFVSGKDFDPEHDAYYLEEGSGGLSGEDGGVNDALSKIGPLLKPCKPGKFNTLAVIGHSWGGDAALEFIARLKNGEVNHTPVKANLLVTYDPRPRFGDSDDPSQGTWNGVYQEKHHPEFLNKIVQVGQWENVFQHRDGFILIPPIPNLHGFPMAAYGAHDIDVTKTDQEVSHLNIVRRHIDVFLNAFSAMRSERDSLLE